MAEISSVTSFFLLLVILVASPFSRADEGDCGAPLCICPECHPGDEQCAEWMACVEGEGEFCDQIQCAECDDYACSVEGGGDGDGDGDYYGENVESGGTVMTCPVQEQLVSCDDEEEEGCDGGQKCVSCSAREDAWDCNESGTCEADCPEEGLPDRSCSDDSDYVYKPYRVGHAHYCTVDCRCDEGQGDCDNDLECMPGLRCAVDQGNAHDTIKEDKPWERLQMYLLQQGEDVARRSSAKLKNTPAAGCNESAASNSYGLGSHCRSDAPRSHDRTSTAITSTSPTGRTSAPTRT